MSTNDTRWASDSLWSVCCHSVPVLLALDIVKAIQFDLPNTLMVPLSLMAVEHDWTNSSSIKVCSWVRKGPDSTDHCSIILSTLFMCKIKKAFFCRDLLIVHPTHTWSKTYLRLSLLYLTKLCLLEQVQLRPRDIWKQHKDRIYKTLKTLKDLSWTVSFAFRIFISVIYISYHLHSIAMKVICMCLHLQMYVCSK